MAITWGAWAMRDRYYGHRVGIEVNQQGGHVQLDFYFQSNGTISWNGTLNEAGQVSRTVPINASTSNPNGGTWHLDTMYFDVAAGQSWSEGCSTVLFWGGTCDVWVSGTAPVGAPPAPTGLKVTYKNDQRIDVSWTLNGTDAGPDRYVHVDRSVIGGGWVRVANLGAVSSWIDVNVWANQRFTYRVFSCSDAACSGFSTSVAESTKPAPPTDVAAVKNADGSITVTWKNAAPYGGQGWRIYDNGTEAATVGANVFSWKQPNPTAVAHTYTVAMLEMSNGNAKGLVSDQSQPSNVVNVLSKPSPPTLIEPTGGAGVVAGSVTLKWRHNPNDTTAQTAWQRDYRRVGDSQWLTKTGNTSAQQDAMDTQAGSYEWRVRTKGQYEKDTDAGWSDWSATGVFTAEAKATINVTQPANNATVTSSHLTAKWGWSGSSQPGSITVALSSGGSSQQWTVADPASTSFAIPTTLVNSSSYTLTVSGKSKAGIEATAGTSAFTVQFTPPAQPTVTPVWDEATGAVSVKITNDSPATAATTTGNTVERSLDGGTTWESVGEAAKNGSISDAQATSWGDTHYRVTAYTADGATSTKQASINVQSKALWIGAGPTYQDTLRLPYNPKIGLTTSLPGRVTLRFAGRDLRVELSGVGTDRDWTISALLLASALESRNGTCAQPDDVDRVALTPGPVCLRSFEGKRIYGSLHGVQIYRQYSGCWTMQATITQTEPAGTTS